MVFYLLELSRLPHGCSIAKLHSPIERRLKSLLVLGLNLLGPLLSPAVAKAMHSLTISLNSITSVCQSKLL